MKQPDLFERMAEQEYEKWLNGDMSQRGWLQVAERCLKRQHAAYVRIVKREAGIFGKRYESCSIPFDKGYAIACADILAAFARYRKGKP